MQTSAHTETPKLPTAVTCDACSCRPDILYLVNGGQFCNDCLVPKKSHCGKAA